MTASGHDEMVELVAAYALDAVEPDEAAAVEEHISRCARCAADLAEFREVAALLANSGGDASADVWQAIAAGIERPGDRGGDGEGEGEGEHSISHLLPGAPAGPARPAKARPAKSPPSRRFAKAWLAAAAAAAGVIGVLGFQVARLDQRVNQLQSASGQPAVAAAAVSALADPQARHILLDSAAGAGQPVAEIAVLPSGTAFLVNRRLPPLPATETYQLWGKLGGDLVSLGILGPAPGDIAFHVDPGADVVLFAVTAERAGGVVRSTHTPVAVSPAAA